MNGLNRASSQIKTLPGVFDIVPKDNKELWRSSHLWQYVEKAARECATSFGFKEIRTPLIERTELFVKNVGDSSDIVTKEMYTFLDKGGRSITLRPEGTVPAVRAFIENNLEAPQKLFYLGPQFRYERQQKGRYRQHHQFGLEAIGIKSAVQDAEVIHLLFQFYETIGLKNLTVHLNSLGGEESRRRYRADLTFFFKKHVTELSDDSKNRLAVNPLRILDSKDERDKEIVSWAPNIKAYLTNEERCRIDKVCASLQRLKIPFEYKETLVRGLDYYNETVFEVVSGSAQNSLGGGGRYDGLVKRLGGADLGAVGSGVGLERVIQTLVEESDTLPEEPKSQLHLVVGEELAVDGLSIANTLRQRGVSTGVSFEDSKKSFKRTIERVSARYVCVLSEKMVREGILEYKNKETQKSYSLKIPNSK